MSADRVDPYAPTYSVVCWYDGGSEGRRSRHYKYPTPELAEAHAQRLREHPADWVGEDSLRHGVEVPHQRGGVGIGRREAMERLAARAEKGDTIAARSLAALERLDARRPKGGDADR